MPCDCVALTLLQGHSGAQALGITAGGPQGRLRKAAGTQQEPFGSEFQLRAATQVG